MPDLPQSSIAPMRAVSNAATEPGRRCANCGAELAGTFCASCGQRGDVGALSVGALLKRSGVELTSFERPFLRTAIGMLTRPGLIASEYVRGRRVHYSNPIKWALLSTGLAFLAAKASGAQGLLRMDVGPTEEMPGWARPLFTFLASNTAPLFVVLLLPILALAMRVCFWRDRRTFAEELVLVLYCNGAAAIVQIPCTAFVLLGAPAKISAPLPLIWTAWAAVAFHPGQRAAVSIVLTVFAHLLWVLMMGMILAAAFLVGAVL